eukprot:jgi/Botrbrau1/18321/Bobra.0179s0049.1
MVCRWKQYSKHAHQEHCRTPPLRHSAYAFTHYTTYVPRRNVNCGNVACMLHFSTAGVYNSRVPRSCIPGLRLCGLDYPLEATAF